MIYGLGLRKHNRRVVCQVACHVVSHLLANLNYSLDVPVRCIWPDSLCGSVLIKLDYLYDQKVHVNANHYAIIMA